MKTKLYFDNSKMIAGMTLKDESEPQSGNMAIHVCVNQTDVIENRRKLAVSLHCDLDDFVSSYQTHSSNFHKVTLADKGRGSNTMNTAILDTDALYTYESNLLLCCFTADCVPVIFYHEVDGLIGIIHSGWKGTVKEITPKILEHLINFEDCDPKYLNVIIGSALSQEKFEVDSDVYERFKNLGYADECIYFNKQTHKYYIDNQVVVRKQCEMKGIRRDKILVDRTCTFQDPEHFSYRQDKSCGRHPKLYYEKVKYI